MASLPTLSLPAKCLLVFLALYVALLGYLCATVPDEQFWPMFSEQGWFEILSIVFWLLAAVCTALKARSFSSIQATAACLFVFCALREADWHKKFTLDSMSKLKYYTKSAAPFSEKLIAAGVMAVFVWLVLRVIWQSLPYLRSSSILRQERVWLMVSGAVLFVGGKILDRALSILSKSFNVIVSADTKRIVSGYEEGLEMITPLLFLLVCFWPGPPQGEEMGKLATPRA
jgi:hypothetical protein